MPPLRETLPFAWPVLRSLVEPKNLAARASAVYRRARRLRARPEPPVHLGDLQASQPIPGGLDLRCDGGVMRVELVSDGVARVRTSRDGSFPSPESYAVMDPARQAQPGRLDPDSLVADARTCLAHSVPTLLLRRLGQRLLC
jgi:hypothetical protein